MSLQDGKHKTILDGNIHVSFEVVSGKIHGEVILHNKNDGSIEKLSYKKGKINGTYNKFNKTGNLVETRRYKNNILLTSTKVPY